MGLKVSQRSGRKMTHKGAFGTYHYHRKGRSEICAKIKEEMKMIRHLSSVVITKLKYCAFDWDQNLGFEFCQRSKKSYFSVRQFGKKGSESYLTLQQDTSSPTPFKCCWPGPSSAKQDQGREKPRGANKYPFEICIKSIRAWGHFRGEVQANRGPKGLWDPTPWEVSAYH